MKTLHKYNNFLNIFLGLLFLSKFLFSNSQILNHIIKLGEYPFKYNHFSYNSDGDLIIDTESFMNIEFRNFFGIKKNGQEYFIDNQGNKNYHYSMNISYDGAGRMYGESCFIKMYSAFSIRNGKEFLLGISKAYKSMYKTEFYNLDDKFTYRYSTDELFGEITNNVFSIIPDPLNTNTKFNYFISYITVSLLKTYKFYTIKANFYFNTIKNKGMNKQILNEMYSVDQSIISCFFTINYLYICFYIGDDLYLTIWVFDPVTKQDEKTRLFSFITEDYHRFYKGIHLKDEIGFFTYFRNSGDQPYFSIYKIQPNKIANIFKSYNEIIIPGSYLNDEVLNDLIKLNDNMICFVGSSLDKKKINIVTFILFQL